MSDNNQVTTQNGDADTLETNRGSDTDKENAEKDAESKELLARLEILRERNQRLRKELTRARRSRYRRTGLLLALVGVASLAGGVVLPDTRQVLFILGGTGIFA
ncbi:MAG: hypothetical protein SXQ77_03490, partial [Halobacteria archaeon]|nr:hypothetical protein [Halobacteria archaeon]